MSAIRQFVQRHLLALLFAFGLAGLSGNAVYAQNPPAIAGQISPQPIPGIDNNIEASLVAENSAVPGNEVMLAILFEPLSAEWHGYWKNPGDAGYGLALDWDLPDGWQVGEPQYPVPQKLLIFDLMNHVYKGEHAVLVPLTVPAGASPGDAAQIAVDAQWLACTDEICVAEQGRLELALPIGDAAFGDNRFLRWRTEIPAMLDSEAHFETNGTSLRMAIPVPEALNLADPHVYIADLDLVQYAAVQTFMRDGDMLVAEIPLSDPDADPATVEAVLSFGDSNGVRFIARPGDVPSLGIGAAKIGGQEVQSLPWLLLAALAGGLILNIMPCVFPILSLKALSLAKAGGSEQTARREGVAYSAGVILACVALGALMLALRSAGQQVGWAFQLQEPGVVVILLVLAAVITANFAGVFDVPSISLTRSGEPASAFATGLLAAVAATPCTGPFMAAALGAALLLPPVPALALFAALGLGLALPFLLIGFVPALRNWLPKPGPWMERFRKLMAIPMGLTALALIWLVARLGGREFAVMALVLVAGLIGALIITGRLQRAGKMAWPAFGLIAAPFVLFAAFALPSTYSSAAAEQASSIHRPLQYSADALAEARAGDAPVFIWFTADWCLTCKVNERVAIEREAVKDAFEAAGVVTMRGDWTRRDAAITAYLAERGAAGVPLYVWYQPGEDGEQLPQILTPESLVALAEGSTAPPVGTSPADAQAAVPD